MLFANALSSFDLAIHWIDLVILITYVVGVVLFGMWIGRGQKNTTDYLLGGQNVSWWAVLISIVATETSTITFLSIPGLAFVASGGDFRFLQLCFGYIIARFIVALVLLPLYFQGKIFTAYEVLHRRFGGATKKAASFLFILTRNTSDGLRLYLTALVLQQILGWNFTICVVAMGLTTIVYTVMGGMKSVIWNDVIQFFVYVLGGILAIAVIANQLPGGWGEIVQFGAENNKFRLLDIPFDISKNYTLWSGLIGGLFVGLASHGTDQMMVQRYLSAKNQRHASVALVGSGFIVFAQFALFLFVGVALAAFYHVHPTGEAFKNTDKVFAAFIVDSMPIGIVGITLAAVFSAAMSTLSSSLSSSASAALNDFYIPRFRNKPKEKHLLYVSRTLTVFFGFIQIAIGIAGQWLQKGTPVVGTVLAIASITSGATLGLFFLALLGRKIRQRSALVGLACGILILFYVAFNKYIFRFELSTDAMAKATWFQKVFSSEHAFSVGWPWYAVIGSLSVLLIGLIVDLVWREKESKL